MCICVWCRPGGKGDCVWFGKYCPKLLVKKDMLDILVMVARLLILDICYRTGRKVKRFGHPTVSEHMISWHLRLKSQMDVIAIMIRSLHWCVINPRKSIWKCTHRDSNPELFKHVWWSIQTDCCPWPLDQLLDCDCWVGNWDIRGAVQGGVEGTAVAWVMWQRSVDGNCHCTDEAIQACHLLSGCFTRRHSQLFYNKSHLHMSLRAIVFYIITAILVSFYLIGLSVHKGSYITRCFHPAVFSYFGQSSTTMISLCLLI